MFLFSSTTLILPSQHPKLIILYLSSTISKIVFFGLGLLFINPMDNFLLKDLISYISTKPVDVHIAISILFFNNIKVVTGPFKLIIEL